MTTADNNRKSSINSALIILKLAGVAAIIGSTLTCIILYGIPAN